MEATTPAQVHASPKNSELKFCPRARTLYGYNPATRQRRLVPLRCKCWSCPFCRSRNVVALQHRALAGKPNRLLTLTTKCQYGETPKKAHDRCRPKIALLLARLRKKYGAVEAVCFLERTARGWPHWHLLVRSSYLPQHAVSKIWKRLTGAFIVDVRRIKNASLATRYVAKYVTKTAQEDPYQRLGRIVSFTRKYRLTPRNAAFTGWVWEWLRTEHYTEVRERLREAYVETPIASGWVYDEPATNRASTDHDRIDPGDFGSPLHTDPGGLGLLVRR